MTSTRTECPVDSLWDGPCNKRGYVELCGFCPAHWAKLTQYQRRQLRLAFGIPEPEGERRTLEPLLAGGTPRRRRGGPGVRRGVRGIAADAVAVAVSGRHLPRPAGGCLAGS